MSAPALPVFAIRRHRIGTDGAGVTSLVGVLGCPLSCKYCLNPMARDSTSPARMLSPEALYEALKEDDLYFEATGGGVTFGGGEPLAHAAFLRAFAKLCAGKWKLNVETSLNVPAENALVPADEYIVDVKDMRDDIYRAYTGKDARRMRENLARVLESVGPSRVLVRVPLIPGYNDEKAVSESVRSLEGMGVTRIQTFIYRVRE